MKVNDSRFLISKIHSVLITFVFLFIIQVSTFSDQESLDIYLQNLESTVYRQCEKEVRDSLDNLIRKYGIYGIYPRKQREWFQNSVKVDLEEGHYPEAGARFLRAYETFDDVNYLNAGLKTADFFHQIQDVNGSFPTAALVEKGGKAKPIVGKKHKHPLGVARIEDAHQYPAFCLMLYAYKLTQKAKYLKSAKKLGNLLFEKIQFRDWGCFPDYWDGKYRPIGKAYIEGDDMDLGVPNGGSYSDHATYDGFMTTLVMYHLTKNDKYLKYSSKLGQWLFLTQLGEGDTRGWADNYDRLNNPVYARHHEGLNIDPRNANRFALPMMMWFYVMTKEERYRVLYEETVSWLKSKKHPEGMSAPKHEWFTGATSTPFGWPSEYLPDGTEAWTSGYKSYQYKDPSAWPKELKNLGLVNGGHPKYTAKKVQLQGADKMLAILQNDGLRGWQRLFDGNAHWSSQEFIQKRIEAALRCIDTTTVPETLDQKWQYVWDYRLAFGKIKLKHATYGGHGLLKWTESFTDLWDVHYDWTSRVISVDNWLDVPIPKLQNFMEAEKADFKGYRINNDIWGFSGSGYLEPDARNSHIAWQIYSSISDSVNMVIIWANGTGGDKSMQLILNGSPPRKVTFKGASHSNKWNGKVVNIPMQKGDNTLYLNSKEKGPSIDFIYFTEPVFKSDSEAP
tara:strand:+ start:757 stop:2784 length:2028 start_codon:yes stop_codon:yes gene_type:complete